MTAMKADDPRHGTHAGYLTGCDCDPCALGHYRDNKERHLYRVRHGSCRFQHEDIARVVDPWMTMGLSLHAITKAAGFGNRTDFADVYERRASINRATYRALAAVTEDDFNPNAKLYADLTRKRIYSLMAAGHQLKDMPILVTGQWRTRKYITVDQARAIRDHYSELDFKMGTSALTKSRALNAGHQPPLAWDDPGTLAWPTPPGPICGTRNGYDAHRRAGEKTCEACRTAHRDARRNERDQARKDAA